MKERDFDIDVEMDQEERDEEYARRVLREVRYMESPEREEREDGVEDDEDDEVEVYTESGSGEDKSQSTNIIWLLISGNILLLRGLTKYYGQMVIVAALFLLSIVVMFWSLHLDMQYNALVQDVQLLRERSIRLQEVRFSRCSHSSIIEELKRRGIDLQDPTTPATVIEKRHFW